MDEDDYDENEFCRPNNAINNHDHDQIPMMNMVANPRTSSMLGGGHAIQLDDEEDGDMVEFQRNEHLIMKTQIANHPAYPHLLAAYIQCKKVGAPPDTASVLEEIGPSRRHGMMIDHGFMGLGADPELDYFMESYCEVLERFKEEFSKPLNEATAFLCNIESQLSHLCQGSSIPKPLDFHHPNSEEHDHQQDEDDEDVMNNGDDDGEIGFGVRSGVEDYYQQELKEKLLRKYSGYLTMLKSEFLKKRKKVELPKPAKSTLLQWWNLHSRWPYPTEEEKVKLSEDTGLDQKQINNWFVNQRKRHWKPTEDIKSALINNPTTS